MSIRRTMRINPARVRDMSDEELEAARSAIAAEYQVRASRGTAQAELRRIADMYADAVDDDPPVDLASAAPGVLIGPGQRVRHAGRVWMNASTAFLPVSVTPSVAPALWVDGVKAETL